MAIDGYMENREGHLVPLEQVEDVVIQRNECIFELMGKALEANAVLAKLKHDCQETLSAHLALSNDGVSEENAGMCSTTLESFDGKLVVRLSQVPKLVATEKVVGLQMLIKAALEELAPDLRSTVAGLIKAVLNLESGKDVDIKLLARLGKHKVLASCPSWTKAIDLLPSCTEQVGLRRYYRFYQRDEDGTEKRVELNFSGV